MVFLRGLVMKARIVQRDENVFVVETKESFLGGWKPIYVDNTLKVEVFRTFSEANNYAKHYLYKQEKEKKKYPRYFKVRK